MRIKVNLRILSVELVCVDNVVLLRAVLEMSWRVKSENLGRKHRSWERAAHNRERERESWRSGDVMVD